MSNRDDAIARIDMALGNVAAAAAGEPGDD